ncbi:MAG: protein-methionine-sulfoxide reductase catalytic subunit MsrP [Rhodobacteraceae bacterium]|nr:protein-methionine-sulfoxide reductase catalytic subunit MsrP [Paracoccaceae bacterium]
MHYHKKPDWLIKESRSTDEKHFINRRKILAGMGIATGLAALGGPAFSLPSQSPFSPRPGLNGNYANAGRAVTAESINSTYNNFYEFGSSKNIHQEAQALQSDPWTVTIDGMVDTPFQISVDDLISRIGVEERIYRHRCVEAWSMVVPWVGFPLAKLVEMAKPLSRAKYVQFQTFNNPEVASEQRASWYPWPYTEGLTMAEATNELSLMVVGAYGKVLHKQFGAPMRLHTPWKYGFKSIKSIDRITFTDRQPVGFWEGLQKKEYGFWANVNPAVDHRRWTQATERPLSGGDRIPTQLYNGYGDQVAGMYSGMADEIGDAFWR